MLFRSLENRTVEISTQAEVDEKANKETLDFDMTEAIDVDIEEIVEEPEEPDLEPTKQMSMEETPY